jgi:4-hydroxy-3-polyprenylbenzoate decarboxylase
VVLYDGHIDLNNEEDLLWYGTANTDPARDFFLSGNRLLIDARAKRNLGGSREWPEEIRMSAEMRHKVTARAKELGIADLEEAGPAHYET